MKKVSCIICPNSCAIEIDENTLLATGNRCPRGLEYAKQEIIDPHRSVTSTVKTIFSHFPVLPVRTSNSISKTKVMDVMKAINEIVVKSHVKVGDIILSNIADTGVDLIATSDIPNK